jgi:hypothetical protein
MFTGELAESRQTEVTIRDIDEHAMELLIDFCYTSHIVVEEANVQTLLPAGNHTIYARLRNSQRNWNTIKIIFSSMSTPVSGDTGHLLRVS